MQVINYDSWLLQFALSEAWRVGTVYRQELDSLAPQFVADLNSALQEWGSYLLGTTSDPGPRQHYLLLLSNVPVAGTDMNPSALDWFLMRGVDGAPIVGNGELFVYTKLPGLAFVSAILPSSLAMLAGHEIRQTGQTTGTMTLPEPLRRFVLDRAEDSMKSIGY